MKENAAEKVVREAKKLEQWEEDRKLMVEVSQSMVKHGQVLSSHSCRYNLYVLVVC